MENLSFWEAIEGKQKSYPRLEADHEVDVVVVGGGITGITTALQLTSAGKKVALLEAHKIGSSTTGYSTGNLYVAVQPYYQNLLRHFKEEVVATIAHSRFFAINFIEEIAQRENINCHFHRRPWFLYTNDNEQVKFLEREIEAIKKFGLEIEFTKNLHLPLKFKKAAMMKNQARFNPLKYVLNLAQKLTEKGCLVFENSRVISYEEEKDHTIFHTANAKITAKKGIIATHTPLGINPVQMFTAPYRSYVVGATLKNKEYPDGNFWDLQAPHHATSTHTIHGEKPDILMVAGNHHKTGQDSDSEKRYAEHEKYLKKHYEVDEILYKWSAQHYQAADGIPYIGLASRFAKNTYMATGFFADGLIYGTLAGIILSDLILSKENVWFEIYKANRFDPTNFLPSVVKENINVFAQYMKDYPLLGKVDYRKIKKGEGRVVQMDQEKWAVSRDENDQLHVVSAVCTHMKCIVNWNNAEKTWDCPCHGSRFTPEGKVIEGPACFDLKKKKES